MEMYDNLSLLDGTLNTVIESQWRIVDRIERKKSGSIMEARIER